MQLPTPVLRPPFNVTRASHVVLTVADLKSSRLFYEEVIGLILTEEADGALYFRGIEEACHHSLVLRQSTGAPVCARVGMRMLSEEDLEEAFGFFEQNGCAVAWAEVPFQGRTLHVTDWVGTPLEFCARMPVVPRQITQFARHRGGCAQRIDHYQIVTPHVPRALRFYNKMGFRLTEYIAGGEALRGVFLQRKGNPHDIVFFHGAGPRLHHVAFFAQEGANLLEGLRHRRQPWHRRRGRARARAARAGARDVCLFPRSRRPPRRIVQHALPGDGHRERAGALERGRPECLLSLGPAGAGALVRTGDAVRGRDGGRTGGQARAADAGALSGGAGMKDDTFVLIAGGGPIGLSAAIELSWRGVPYVLVNERLETATHPKCNNTNARSMEHFRRLGIAKELRAEGLPPDVERASAYVTRYCGHEFGRLPRPWGEWPTPELPATISQIALERTLRRIAESRPGAEIHFGCKLESFTADDAGVTAQVASAGGERHSIRARYLLGADGASSTVRRALGVEMTGEDGTAPRAFMGGTMLSYYIRAPKLVERSGRKPSQMTWIINPEMRAMMYAQDGGERWVAHYQVPQGQSTGRRSMRAPSSPPCWAPTSTSRSFPAARGPAGWRWWRSIIERVRCSSPATRRICSRRSAGSA